MRRFVTLFLAFAALTGTAVAIAQDDAPTAEEMQQLPSLSPDQILKLQSLSPEDRKNLLKEMRKEPGAVARPIENPVVVAPAPVRNPEAAGTSIIEQHYANSTRVATLAQSPSTRAISQQLKQFGYDLFAGAPTTFAPATDIPVPADYVIGPGDIIQLQLFGKENSARSLVVGRDGQIQFPEIGAISVAGLSFNQVRAEVDKRVTEQMIGVKASVTMGPLRSIRVFVLGEVTRPGSYTVSSLTTMTNALFVSGGVKPIGSLRNVQLKRNGRVVTRMDLYDLLLRGDTSDDARLQPGDVIFVPPIGPTAGIAGEVRRPAIYELRGEKSVKQLVEIAGGLLPSAVPKLSQLERTDAKGSRTLVDVDLENTVILGEAKDLLLHDGDVLRIYPTLDRMEGVVLLAGHARRPGGVAWHDHMRIADLIPNADVLQPQPDLDYVVIRREERPLAKVIVFSTRLGAAWADPTSDANTLLEPRDQVFVFPTASGISRSDVIPSGKLTLNGSATPSGSVTPNGNINRSGSVPGGNVTPSGNVILSEAKDPFSRSALLKPLLDELAAQAKSGEPTRIASVDGLVREPGGYPLEPGMRVSDLIRASGGLSEAAYTLGAEVTRYQVANGEKREISHVAVELDQVLKGDAASNLALQPFDNLTIKRLPEWSEQLTAELRGEVRFPGIYPIKRGEKLSDLLERAGGLTDQAFPDGSVFTREELRAKEQQRIDTLAQQLESDIAALSLEKAQEGNKESEALATARTLLPQLRSAKATGRLVIDLPQLLKEGKSSEYDVALKGGDTLIIPQKTQEVTVIGEVQYPTSHLVERGLDVADYVGRSGGLTYRADNGRAYVVRANGQVEPARSGWWIFSSDARVKAGDTIVVPLDVERMRPLTFWTNVSQIIYQLAVTIAVLNSIGAI